MLHYHRVRDVYKRQIWMERVQARHRTPEKFKLRLGRIQGKKLGLLYEAFRSRRI